MLQGYRVPRFSGRTRRGRVTRPDILDAFTGVVLKTWIFVMTLCFGRHGCAGVVTGQKVSTWLACHCRAFECFGGVPACRYSFASERSTRLSIPFLANSAS